jgi:hypothetical protein
LKRTTSIEALEEKHNFNQGLLVQTIDFLLKVNSDLDEQPSLMDYVESSVLLFKETRDIK